VSRAAVTTWFAEFGAAKYVDALCKPGGILRAVRAVRSSKISGLVVFAGENCLARDFSYVEAWYISAQEAGKTSGVTLSRLNLSQHRQEGHRRASLQ
jgi:hypothetical protein